MLNYETLLSTYDDKLTLMQWLKKVEEALKDASATSFDVIKTGDATLKFAITFEDGTSLVSGEIVLQQGESVASGEIRNGHLILTLTNGDELDAGLLFSGDVVINGNLEVTGMAKLPRIEGDENGDIAIEGDINLNDGNIVITDGNIEVNGDIVAQHLKSDYALEPATIPASRPSITGFGIWDEDNNKYVSSLDLTNKVTINLENSITADGGEVICKYASADISNNKLNVIFVLQARLNNLSVQGTSGRLLGNVSFWVSPYTGGLLFPAGLSAVGLLDSKEISSPSFASGAYGPDAIFWNFGGKVRASTIVASVNSNGRQINLAMAETGTYTAFTGNTPYQYYRYEAHFKLNN